MCSSSRTILGLSADQAEMSAALAASSPTPAAALTSPTALAPITSMRRRATKALDALAILAATSGERQRRQPDDQQEQERAHAQGDGRELEPAGDPERDLGARSGAGSADQPGHGLTGRPGCPIEKLNPLETMWPSADTTR